MAVFSDLKSLMAKAVTWENRLTEFYEQAEALAEFAGCKHVIAMLKEKHEQNLNIINGVNVEDFGRDEWVRGADDIDLDDILSFRDITPDTLGCDVARHIIDFETRFRDFYRSLADEIVTAEEKELFASLAIFKEKQIFEIKRCLENHKNFEGHTQ